MSIQKRLIDQKMYPDDTDEAKVRAWVAKWHSLKAQGIDPRPIMWENFNEKGDDCD